MTDWLRGAVVYQIYPRSFRDTNGDGVGDLAGVIEKLDHVVSLGCDAIWLSPFFTSPMKDYGYDVADYRGVDPLFGSLADADALIAKAHLLGLKVIIDQVWSHSSDQHAWFSESRASRDNPRADWYVWADAKPDGSPPNNWQAMFGGCACVALTTPAVISVARARQIGAGTTALIASRWATTCLIAGLACSWSWERGM